MGGLTDTVLVQQRAQRSCGAVRILQTLRASSEMGVRHRTGRIARFVARTGNADAVLPERYEGPLMVW